MKFKLHYLLNGIYSLIALAMIILPIIFFKNAEVNKLFLCCSALIGLLGGYIFCSAMHELGHIICLKRSEVFLTEICVLGLEIAFLGDKRKVRFSLRNSYAGYVSFIAKDPSNAEKNLNRSVVGAAIFSMACLVITSLLTLLVAISLDSPFFVIAFYASCIYSVYFLLVNFYSFMPTSDGNLLFNKNNCMKKTGSILKTQSYLFLGKSLLEIDEQLFATEDNYVNGYYSYLRLLQKGDIINAQKLFNTLVQENEKTHDNQLISLFLEEFYLDILNQNKDKILQKEDSAVYALDSMVSPTSYRIMIAYRKWTGEKEWLDALLKGFDAQSNCLLKGLWLTEKQIINNLTD